MSKWSKKEAIRHLQELKSPFEKQPEQAKPLLPNMAEQIRQIAMKNRGVKPE